MIFRYIFVPVIIFAGFYNSSFALETDNKRPFLVDNSISMVRIVDPDVAMSVFTPPKIKTSPDGKYFIVVTRRGNLVAKKNDYSLILYQTEKVLTFLNQGEGKTLKSPIPKGKVLAKASTSRNESAFQKIAWLEGSKALAFIGWFDTEVDQTSGQVYRLDIQSGNIQKLTHHPKPIISFAISTALQKIIFASSISKSNIDRNKSSYLVGVRHMNAITDPSWEAPPPDFQYYIQDMDKPGRPVAVGRIYSGFPPYSIWLSPDKQQAIILTTKKHAPEHWLEGYNYLKSPFYKSSLKDFDENTMMRRESILTEFSLLDISRKEIKPAIDAPTGLYVGGLSVTAQWLPDSRSVILANTALPLDKEWPCASQLFATVEYNPATGQIEPITYHKARKAYRGPNTTKKCDIPGGQFYGLKIEPSGRLRITQVNDHQEPLVDKYFQKENGEWVQVTAPAGSGKPDPANRLEIKIYQDLNNPPEIMALDRSTDRKSIISDFNPQFRSLTFGKTEVFSWRDRTGRNWKGGLVYPPGFEKGKKYPLVIQTHGFNDDEFLIDGPFDTASSFAAQALANSNILVLQMMSPAAPHDRDERFIYQDGFESLIDQLFEQGLIDRDKVGLIGWSGTGVTVQQMLLYSDYPIAAAIVSDSYNYGLSSYISFFGIYAPGMAFMEQLNGSVPWGEGLRKWVENDPTFHLDLLKTPLRYEQYSDEISHWWATYAILKRQKKPVEYYRFNDAAHALIKPEHRKTSQQGTVDWFTFWLKGEEDPDPAKADQYQRWRKLRIQQEKSEIAATQARIRDKSN